MNKFDPKGGEKKTRNTENVRIYVLCFIFFLMAFSIFARLYVLQVLSYGYYKDLADNQHSIFKNLIPDRGEIFLKEGSGLYSAAVNKETKLAYAVPREMDDPLNVAQKISEVLGLDREELERRFSQPEDMYEILKHRLSEEEIGRINDLKLKGVHLSPESYRYYPALELSSQILGYVGWKGDDFGGRYGVENYFEEELSGQHGRLFQKKDNSGVWAGISSKEISPAKNGSDLVLTVDHIIQYEAEKIIANAINKFEAEKGVAIVMEADTGKILARASYPNFNPNDYKNVPMENFRNLAVSDSYECGSVFKPFTLASAIDAGQINPSTAYTDTGSVVEAGYNIRNSDLKSNGVQTMTEVLEKSLNTGVIFAEKLLGNANFSDYMKRFGFGETTGIELPGEATGNIANLKNPKRTINFFTASFGQGITVTPIQLISAYNAIANEGMLMKPQIIDKIIHVGGNEETIEPKEVRKVISASAARQTSEMLESVVLNGHGKAGGVPGYRVGGKTGTAQVVSTGSKGYTEGKHIGSFAGFAPIDNPKFTILVRIDNPKNVEWAESSAAPAFGELMKFVLEYKNVRPTEEYSKADLDHFNQTHTLREYVTKEEREAKEKEKEEKKEEDYNKIAQ